jgi:exopolysaccharide biosynthesis WecB/TagA/CpsF family protein
MVSAAATDLTAGVVPRSILANCPTHLITRNLTASTSGVGVRTHINDQGVRCEMREGPSLHAKLSLPTDWPKVQLGGIVTDLLEVDDAIGIIIEHARVGRDDLLGVVSLNLDHLHHFGSVRAAARISKGGVFDTSLDGRIQWLSLLDGAPLVKRARELTGRSWPRLAGSDLIHPIFDLAQVNGLSIGILGGSAETHAELAPNMLARWPTLHIAGLWAPERSVLDNPGSAAALAHEIRHAHVDILVVCLGKPRQERWIAEHGPESGAKVCLAFGAVVDFLAGRVDRAPRWLTDHGLEWAWRLANEPRRLARRYLIQGPFAYISLKRQGSVHPSAQHSHRSRSSKKSGNERRSPA